MVKQFLPQTTILITVHELFGEVGLESAYEWEPRVFQPQLLSPKSKLYSVGGFSGHARIRVLLG